VPVQTGCPISLHLSPGTNCSCASYGVRVFTDAAAVDAKLPDEPTLEALLACEEQAGARDPYRAVAALTHLIADHLTPT
jgi:S-adenosylmethionine-dependent methyltransferase